MRNDHHELTLVCSGLVLARLFPIAGSTTRTTLPSLADVVRARGIADEPLARLGIDSLAWLELVTRLESEFGLQLADDFLVEEHVTARTLGAALSRALAAHAHAHSHLHSHAPA